mgnify:CR=1 FL=1
MEELKNLIDDIYNYIRAENNSKSTAAIPYSEDLYKTLAKKYNLITFNVPRLVNILVQAKMIFIFKVVEPDRKNKVVESHGFVVAEGNIITTLRKIYEDEFLKYYFREFNKKQSAKEAIEEFLPQLESHNNSPLGKNARIVIMLTHYEVVLEKEILNFSKKVQAKLLDDLLEDVDISEFRSKQKEGSEKKIVSNEINGKEDSQDRIKKSNELSNSRRAVDSSQLHEFKSFSKNHSLEKTIAIYGIEFYTRVCFRDYLFDQMAHLVEKGVIHKKNDLMKLKRMLQQQRMNSDNDLNLQKYAAEINKLEKQINQRLKS